MKKVLSVFISAAALIVISLFALTAAADEPVNELNASNTAVSTYYSEYQYAGIEIKPALTVKYKGLKLVNGRDYVAEYSNCLNAGTATATVKGIGNYSGTVIKNYPIIPVKPSNEIKVSLEYNSISYNGKERKPKITAKYRRDTLIEGKDYTLSYSSNKNIGVATVTIKGKGNYAFTLKKTFKIVPKSVGKLSYSPEVNAVTVKWPKMSGITGYQVVVYDKSKKAYKTVKFVSGNTTSLRITGLNPSTLYTYNVRAYKEFKGKPTIYGVFTNDMLVRTRSSATTMTSAVKKGNTITAKWKTVRGAGYVLIYATDYKFRNAKEIYLNDSRIGSYTIRNINPKSVYYLKICPYTTSHNGGKWFSKKSDYIATAYTKAYSAYSTSHVNNANRTTNLRVASNAINGTIVYPGETFSFNKVVGQRTAARGYKKATVFTGPYSSKQELGGGICQVVSTMYNAALYANVQIVERHQHVQRVSYVYLGRDAAVTWGSQDFRWKNNTKYPIRIEMNVKNGKVNCKFYTCQGATKPSIKISVSQSGKNFTMKRTANGKVNYTAKSRY